MREVTGHRCGTVNAGAQSGFIGVQTCGQEHAELIEPALLPGSA